MFIVKTFFKSLNQWSKISVSFFTSSFPISIPTSVVITDWYTVSDYLKNALKDICTIFLYMLNFDYKINVVI